MTQWHEAREAEEPRRVKVPIEGLGYCLAMLGQSGADYVFIDTLPQVSENLDPVFAFADLVIVPIKPTPDDLKALKVPL